MGASDDNVRESYDAVPASIPRARTRIGQFAAESGLAGDGLQAVRLAVSEAVTNVVRHAYRGPGGRVHVTAARLSGELVVLIADDGCGYQTPAEDPGFGLGLAAIAVSTDEFAIGTRGGGGTEVRMRFLLAGAAETSHPTSGSIDSAPAPA